MVFFYPGGARINWRKAVEKLLRLLLWCFRRNINSCIVYLLLWRSAIWELLCSYLAQCDGFPPTLWVDLCLKGSLTPSYCTGLWRKVKDFSQNCVWSYGSGILLQWFEMCLSNWLEMQVNFCPDLEWNLGLIPYKQKDGSNRETDKAGVTRWWKSGCRNLLSWLAK